MLNENSSEIQKGFNFSTDFDLLEKILFGESYDFQLNNQNDSVTKKLASDENNFLNSTVEKREERPICRDLPDLPSQWTFDDLYMDFNGSPELFLCS